MNISPTTPDPIEAAYAEYARCLVEFRASNAGIAHECGAGCPRCQLLVARSHELYRVLETVSEADRLGAAILPPFLVLQVERALAFGECA